MSRMSRTLRPAEIANQLGISTSSLRNYEAKGIVPPASRASNGYRVYTDEHIAYFTCIVAMSPGFGMEITSEVLILLQRQELGAALWLINAAQAATHADKLVLEEAEGLMSKLALSGSAEPGWMTIGELSATAGIPTSTLRYWEQDGLIAAARHENNNYRKYDKFQEVKVWILKSTQKAVYSGDTVRLKQAVRGLPAGHWQAMEAVIAAARAALAERNREQLRGLHSLHNLCSRLKLV
ncbi:MerR family DNA-binding transcriptional regulator [Paenibacillus sp. GCM10023248]|uniref:MerR family DNA-binding transcriptional regulator n=1 Tax=Bacillales TaxID=1385 RepID=UPI0023781DD0|nr:MULTISPECIES: MerR family DNA-binding transcriptional regulator [Bacillales]MDD9269012.1 MerR family DNA-binding transcriptional regulator [Paenibacillus sp. MAHUQ-63]MDR6884988.1 DNA-binding transcriptional MerR regulator [Bacillus sp. 3255]